ncbi:MULTISPECIES: hypothetical protein [Streptomyces]|uniref:hypothetical protein n=1 Tax=Streptomyces TaxID=1883 RepID=UPI002108CCCC|nr:hypothetical protein [Streptomyces longispororuber]MCQ4211451.1 hypothetical protein [Streptomyces longispororuber]
MAVKARRSKFRDRWTASRDLALELQRTARTLIEENQILLDENCELRREHTRIWKRQ